MGPRNPFADPISTQTERRNSFKRHQDQIAADDRQAEKKIERLRALRLAKEAEAAVPQVREDTRDKAGAPTTKQPEEPR